MPGADTPEEMQATLDGWARMQDSIPWYRHNTAARGADAGQLTEAVGDADPVQSTRLGLKNVRRTMPLLIPATVRSGENYDELKELYGKLVLQWRTELGHVVATVGGVDSQEKYGGQEGPRFESLPAERQAEAVTFLNEQAFRTPEYLLDQQVLRRIAVSGAIDRIDEAQSRLLSDLLRNSRMERMVEFQALAGSGERVYTLDEMLGDVRRGIWSELSHRRVRVDAFRIGLQNSYLDLLEDKLSPPADGEERQRRQPSRLIQAMLRGELAAISALLHGALPRASNRMTRDHLRAAGARIDEILHGRE